MTLALHGGGSTILSACGAQHHYRVYPAGTPIVFSGTVSPIPSGRWKVKLKIKVCQGSDFVKLTKVDASENESTGSFTGSFPAPAAGVYEARAELYFGTTEGARSDKRHFTTS